MTRPVVRLMVADSHDVVRRGVRHLFEEQGNYRVVADVRDGREALRLAEQLKPNIAIVDYMLPALNGLDLLHAMRRAGLDTKLQLYTMYDSPNVISSALHAGIRGFVVKSDPERCLIDAVEALSTGKPYFSPTVSDAMLTRFLEGKSRAVVGGLGQRERQVVQLIAEGWINRQIADQLGLTIKTVETHRSRAMHKLKVRTIAELVRWAIRNNLVQA